jgi:hypothetical protein
MLVEKMPNHNIHDPSGHNLPPRKIFSADMSRITIKPKHPPRSLFLTSDPKFIFHRKPLPRKDLEKSEKNSLAKSRFL